MGMTNRKKFKEIYGFDVDCGLCNPYPCPENDCEWWEQCENEPGCPCDGWWEMEYKEPTTKNNLGVDCISRKSVIDELKRYFHDEYYQRTSIQDCRDCFIEDVLIHLSSVTPPEPRWIPISERLPEDGKYVMVTFGGKIAVCLAQDNNGTLQEVTSLNSMNATKIWLYPNPKFGDGYAAWMPLPEPYKAAGEET